MTLPIVVVGLSHKTAPVDVRERFAVGADLMPELLARLVAHPELDEAMFLSTCNRVEVFGLSQARKNHRESASLASSAIREILREHLGATSAAELDPWLYEKTGDEAVRHVFRVAASLDSMVLGEPQILGQVKSAYDAARAAGALRSHLSRCVHHAFTVAKRVRSETQIGAGVVSLSSVAVDLAKRIFGDLSASTVLLIGAGEMAEHAAKALGKSATSIRVCNRSLERAAALASAFHGTASSLDQLEAELVASDVVVASTSSESFIVTRELVKRVMKQRNGRTLFLIDIAVPRNVDPAVHALDNVYVYNVDDLELEVAENMKTRQGEVALAERLVAAELEVWATWTRSLDVAPTVIALRDRTHHVLTSELERTLGGRLKHLPESDRAALAQMVESATNKLLHAPTTHLKAAASAGGDTSAVLVEALNQLFELPKPTEVSNEAEASERFVRSLHQPRSDVPNPVGAVQLVELIHDEHRVES